MREVGRAVERIDDPGVGDAGAAGFLPVHGHAAALVGQQLADRPLGVHVDGAHVVTGEPLAPQPCGASKPRGPHHLGAALDRSGGDDRLVGQGPRQGPRQRAHRAGTLTARDVCAGRAAGHLKDPPRHPTLR